VVGYIKRLRKAIGMNINYAYFGNTYASYVGARLCMRKDLGLNGNLYGGNLLSWIDEIAAIFARKETKEKYVVTYKFGEITFKHPIKEGDLVDFYCHTIERRTSSLKFNIYASIGNETVFTTEAIFVVVDENGNKKSVNWENK